MADNMNGSFVSARAVDGHDTRAAEARQQEADHRIANSIQLAAAMLKFETRRITDAASAKHALAETERRLMAIARMHRQLSRHVSGSTVDLAEFLRPFCDDLAESLGATVELAADDVRLRADAAAQLGLIVNELTANAVKHGGADGRPVTITVAAETAGPAELRLTLSDDGDGLPTGFSLQDTRGLGMTIVTSTVKKLGGRVDIVRADGAGAGFEITLPMAGGGRPHLHAVCDPPAAG